MSPNHSDRSPNNVGPLAGDACQGELSYYVIYKHMPGVTLGIQHVWQQGYLNEL